MAQENSIGFGSEDGSGFDPEQVRQVTELMKMLNPEEQEEEPVDAVGCVLGRSQHGVGTFSVNVYEPSSSNPKARAEIRVAPGVRVTAKDLRGLAEWLLDHAEEADDLVAEHRHKESEFESASSMSSLMRAMGGTQR